MKTLIPVSLIISISLLFQGCLNIKYQQAIRHQEAMAYTYAIEGYEDVIKKKESAEVKIRLADCYRLVNNSVKSEALYQSIVLMPACKPEHKFYYAQALMQNAKYEEAGKWFDQYLQLVPDDIAASRWASSCRNIEKLLSDSSRYIINYLPLNTSEGSAFCPVFYKDGIVFATDQYKNLFTKQYSWTGNDFLGLYYSQKTGFGSWSIPEKLGGDLNSEYHDGPAIFSNDNTTVYFTRNCFLKNNKKQAKGKAVNNLKLFVANNNVGRWTDAEPLSFSSDDYSTGHPALSNDGKKLFFISDMPGGFGGTDIYISEMIDGKWMKPVNAGSVINTHSDEMFPYISPDGTLYFSSNGHGGLGGLDIFYSRFDQTWSQPVNPGYPINSSGDDFGIIIDKQNKSGYFSSNRNDNSGLDHIYSFIKNEPGTDGSDIVFHQFKKDAVRSDTQLQAKINPEAIDIAKAEIAPNNSYNLEQYNSGDGEIPGTEIVQASYASKNINIKYIYYDFDQWEIRADAAVELDNLISIMKAYPRLTATLSAHCDCRGSDTYNILLSRKRVLAAYDYLISGGISSGRITAAKWFGEKQLVNTCNEKIACPEEAHQKNRRTEIRINGHGEAAFNINNDQEIEVPQKAESIASKDTE